MDSDETTTMMMRSSTLSHRGGGGGGAGGENASPTRRGSPAPSARGGGAASTTTTTPNGHSKTNCSSSSSLLPITTRSTNHQGNDKLRRRRNSLSILKRIRLHNHRQEAYIVCGLVAIMLLVFKSSMSTQFHWQSSFLSSSLSSLSSSSSSYQYHYSPGVSVYTPSVTLYKLPDYAGLPVPVLPHMYKEQEDNNKGRNNNSSYSNTTLSTVQKWKPDYGGIDVRIMMADDDNVPRRIMFRNGNDLRNSYTSRGDGDDTVSWYYITDDAVQRNPTLQFDDDAYVHEHNEKDGGTVQECRLNAWEHVVHENCNTFHELDFAALTLQDQTLAIGAGYYRDVFKTQTHFGGEALVFKENSYENAHGSYNYKDYHFVRKDGIVSAAIQPHPLLVDTFGFCALSFFTELMPYGDVAKYAIPIFERCDDDDDDDEREDEKSNKDSDGKKYVKKKPKTFTWRDHTSSGSLIRMNNLTATRKLVWALEMAESIALLNNFEGGVIVHDDVQLVQWLVTEDHEHLKLNDFNRAEVMLYDETNQEYCKYRNNPGNGDWRAPEEYHDYPLDESIDIYSLGNNFYSLLTGLPPFPEECHVRSLQKRIKKKETSWIDPQWKRASFAEGVLVHVIERCWEYKPEDRISIGALVQLLRAAVEENKTKQHQPPPPTPSVSSQRLPPPRRPLGKKTRRRPTNATTPLIQPRETPPRQKPPKPHQ